MSALRSGSAIYYFYNLTYLNILILPRNVYIFLVVPQYTNNSNSIFFSYFRGSKRFEFHAELLSQQTTLSTKLNTGPCLLDTLFCHKKSTWFALKTRSPSSYERTPVPTYSIMLLKSTIYLLFSISAMLFFDGILIIHITKLTTRGHDRGPAKANSFRWTYLNA